MSTGLNSGVSKVIGRSVKRDSLLSEKKVNYTIIGLSSWGCLSDRTRTIFRQQVNICREISILQFIFHYRQNNNNIQLMHIKKDVKILFE